MLCTKVGDPSILLADTALELIKTVIGIGPKISQSVITAAFLFAFKDLLYEATLKARKGVAQKLPVK